MGSLSTEQQGTRRKGESGKRWAAKGNKGPDQAGMERSLNGHWLFLSVREEATGADESGSDFLKGSPWWLSCE